MLERKISRRTHLELLGAGTSMLATRLTATETKMQTQSSVDEAADRARRMKWWHEAKFGMFIHWGLYSVLGRHEWVMENEGIPVAEYEQLAKKFVPKPNVARVWAWLSKRAGMK